MGVLMLRYQPIDHTADLGLRVWGRALPELFANAAEGMCALYFELAAVQPREERAVSADGYDREEVLVDWLRQLLYGIEVDRFLPCRFDILRLEDTRLEAVVRGEGYDPARHRWRTGIKAVTYHDLHVVRDAGGEWSVQIIFDT
jgi:SHS2 domain-containing protein